MVASPHNCGLPYNFNWSSSAPLSIQYKLWLISCPHIGFDTILERIASTDIVECVRFHDHFFHSCSLFIGMEIGQNCAMPLNSRSKRYSIRIRQLETHPLKHMGILEHVLIFGKITRGTNTSSDYFTYALGIWRFKITSIPAASS